MEKKNIENKVDGILKEAFSQYDITDVPDIEQNPDTRLTLGNTGFMGEFAFLYVDMRGSSTFTDQHRLKTITKIYKAYHHCMVESIKTHDGNIRSFDGDRVLGVFGGKRKVNNSIECAMHMTGFRYDILQPKINTILSNPNFSLGIGISTGNAMVSKAGVGYDKNNRDLIWIGNPPNLGAKLSDVAESPFSIYICENTFSKLIDENRYTTVDGIKKDMWVKDKFIFKNSTIDIYKTGYYRSL